jgi:hypothetical protein
MYIYIIQRKRRQRHEIKKQQQQVISNDLAFIIFRVSQEWCNQNLQQLRNGKPTTETKDYYYNSNQQQQKLIACKNIQLLAFQHGMERKK